MKILTSFEFEGQFLPTKFVETQTVKEGVECDIYSFVDDTSKDLAIVRVAKGQKTPLQRVLKGNRTVEGFMSGKGMLPVQSGEQTQSYSFQDGDSTGCCR